jgi:hypothetical protein
MLSFLRTALTGFPEASLPESARAAARRVALLAELRPRLASLSDAALQLSQDASEIQSDVRGQRRLLLATRFTPLAGEMLEHFAGFMDGPLRELDYYTGIYEGLHGMAVLICAQQDPYLASRPLPVLKTDGSGEPDPSSEQTQRCLGSAMGESIEYLQILASPKAGPVVRAIARRELAAYLGSSAEAERMATTAEWRWLGAPPDLRTQGAMGIALTVLLEPTLPCTVSVNEALCPKDLSFEEFLERLRVAGYRPESKAMKAALAGQGRWLSQTMRRALDRAATVEIIQASSGSPSPGSASTRKAMNAVLGGGETVSRAAERTGDVSFQVDPSTIPLHPLADGSYVPIVLAHIVPYRVALDVVGGSIALSWLEPRLQLGRWFSGGLDPSGRRHPVQLGHHVEHARGTGRGASRSRGNRLRASVVVGLGRWVPVRRGVRPDAAPRQGRRLVWIPEPERGELEHSLRRTHHRRPERHAVLAHPSGVAIGTVSSWTAATGRLDPLPRPSFAFAAPAPARDSPATKGQRPGGWSPRCAHRGCSPRWPGRRFRRLGR